MESIIVAAITATGALIGTYISNNRTKDLMEYKISELTREVREHNNFAKRMPVVEEKISVINHRLNDLEKE